MIKDLIKPELKSFVPYNANQVPYRVKLDANESPFDLPETVKKKLADYLLGSPSLNLYPDTDSISLRNSLAQYWDVDPSQIVVGVGSDQLIQVIINIFVGKSDRVICPVPSFGMYKLSTIIAGGQPVEFLLRKDEDYRYNMDELIHTAKQENAKVVFLCTPNNPTGSLIPFEDVERTVKELPNTIIVVDEAYAEFSGETAVSLLSKYENLIILRTFSKAYGLAGIRCGYSISQISFAEEINKVRPPYNQSTIAQLTAQLVFEAREEIDRNIKCLIEQREYLVEEIKKIDDLHVYPSSANFLLVKVPDAAQVSGELQKRGVLLRSFGTTPMLENCIRISVGSKDQNDILIKELKEVMKI